MDKEYELTNEEVWICHQNKTQYEMNDWIEGSPTRLGFF